MTFFTLVVKNITRNKLRSGLTMAAVALPMALFAMTSAVRGAMDEAFSKAALELRLGVCHKITLTNLLPGGMRREIEDIDPARTMIEGVCGVRWFGGRVPDAQFVFPSLAADADTFPVVYSDYGLSGEQLANWHKHKNAAIVGVGTAERMGWVEGQEVELKSTVPPYLNLRFKLVKITSTGLNPAVFYFRRDYMDDALEKAGKQYGAGRANIFWVKCKNPDRMQEFADKIDRRFANTPDETKTQDESTFFASFIRGTGNIPAVVQYISMAVGLAVVMVVANTLSLGFRERIREYAVYRALGFPGTWVSRLVVLESMTLVLAGAVLGLVPMYAIFRDFPIRDLGVGPLARLRIGPETVVLGLVLAAVIGLLAGAAPAVQALRLKAVYALRKVG
jgi:putative ABC transport system permease protein